MTPLTKDTMTIETGEITIPVRFVESTIFTGFRMDWITGTDDEEREIDLTAGAGCGSSWINFEVKGLGSVAIDMREVIPILTEYVKAAAERHQEDSDG